MGHRSTLTAIQAPGLSIFCIPPSENQLWRKAFCIGSRFSANKHCMKYSRVCSLGQFIAMVACRTKVATPVMHYRIQTFASGHTQLGAALYRARGVCGCCAENDDMPYTDMKSSMI